MYRQDRCARSSELLCEVAKLTVLLGRSPPLPCSTISKKWPQCLPLGERAHARTDAWRLDADADNDARASECVVGDEPQYAHAG